jgi:hypothetical protein
MRGARTAPQTARDVEPCKSKAANGGSGGRASRGGSRLVVPTWVCRRAAPDAWRLHQQRRQLRRQLDKVLTRKRLMMPRKGPWAAAAPPRAPPPHTCASAWTLPWHARALRRCLSLRSLLLQSAPSLRSLHCPIWCVRPFARAPLCWVLFHLAHCNAARCERRQRRRRRRSRHHRRCGRGRRGRRRFRRARRRSLSGSGRSGGGKRASCQARRGSSRWKHSSVHVLQQCSPPRCARSASVAASRRVVLSLACSVLIAHNPRS